MGREFATVGVIGLGTMGAGIVEVFAREGLSVIGVEPNEEALERGRGHLRHSTDRAVKRGKLTDDDQTALIGKWHLGTDPQGFDYWNIFPGQGRYHDPQLREMGHKELTTYKRKYSTDVVTDLTLDWLKKRDKDKPFFMMCHFKAPHRPWDPAARFKDLYNDDTIPEPPTLGDDYSDRSEAAKRAKMRVGENMTKRDFQGQTPPAGLSV